MIRKIDSNKFSLTILKVTTFSRIRQPELTWRTPNSCGEVSIRDTFVLELHEPSTTNNVNNIIPNNSFILFILYRSLSFKRIL